MCRKEVNASKKKKSEFSVFTDFSRTADEFSKNL